MIWHELHELHVQPILLRAVWRVKFFQHQKMTLFSIVNVSESSQSEYGKGRQARKKSEKYAKALTEIVKEDNNNTIESC